MNSEQQAFLREYLNGLSSAGGTPVSFSAGHFCADEENANLCVELIRSRIKTATCSLKQSYAHEGEPWPTVGHLHVLTSWDQSPALIIETTKVEERPFSAVDEAFAKDEGEGDLSLEWWRRAHWEFFAGECKEVGVTPHEEMPLILEWFTVVYENSQRNKAMHATSA